MEQRFKLILSYDGTEFVGWQQYEDLPTIEGTLKPILEKIFNQPLLLEAASRTDAGVHAKAQVVCFSFKDREFPPDKLKLSLNQMLPKSVRVLEVSECPLSFHPSVDVKSKTYTYHLTSGAFQHPFDRLYSWHVVAPLDQNKIDEAIPHFLGTKDFTSFVNQSASPPKETTRTLFSIAMEEEKPGHYTVKVSGDRFMYKMVRNIVGTLVAIGKGVIEPAVIPSLIEAKDRTKLGATAPACGLFLTHINYG